MRSAWRYTQKDVKRVLDESGLIGKYTFIYMPFVPSRRFSVGYAFVRFRTGPYASECRQLFHGCHFGQGNPTKPCEVVLARTPHGLGERQERMAASQRRGCGDLQHMGVPGRRWHCEDQSHSRGDSHVVSDHAHPRRPQEPDSGHIRCRRVALGPCTHPRLGGGGR